MYYVSKNDSKDFLSPVAFRHCGNSKRADLLKEYRALSLKEMVNIADAASAWTDLPEGWYVDIARAINVDIDDEKYEDLENLIDDAREFLEANN